MNIKLNIRKFSNQVLNVLNSQLLKKQQFIQLQNKFQNQQTFNQHYDEILQKQGAKTLLDSMCHLQDFLGSRHYLIGYIGEYIHSLKDEIKSKKYLKSLNNLDLILDLIVKTKQETSQQLFELIIQITQNLDWNDNEDVKKFIYIYLKSQTFSKINDQTNLLKKDIQLMAEKRFDPIHKQYIDQDDFEFKVILYVYLRYRAMGEEVSDKLSQQIENMNQQIVLSKQIIVLLQQFIQRIQYKYRPIIGGLIAKALEEKNDPTLDKNFYQFYLMYVTQQTRREYMDYLLQRYKNCEDLDFIRIISKRYDPSKKLPIQYKQQVLSQYIQLFRKQYTEDGSKISQQLFENLNKLLLQETLSTDFDYPILIDLVVEIIDNNYESFQKLPLYVRSQAFYYLFFSVQDIYDEKYENITQSFLQDQTRFKIRKMTKPIEFQIINIFLSKALMLQKHQFLLKNKCNIEDMIKYILVNFDSDKIFQNFIKNNFKSNPVVFVKIILQFLYTINIYNELKIINLTQSMQQNIEQTIKKLIPKIPDSKLIIDKFEQIYSEVFQEQGIDYESSVDNLLIYNIDFKIDLLGQTYYLDINGLYHFGQHQKKIRGKEYVKRLHQFYYLEHPLVLINFTEKQGIQESKEMIQSADMHKIVEEKVRKFDNFRKYTVFVKDLFQNSQKQDELKAQKDCVKQYNDFLSDEYDTYEIEVRKKFQKDTKEEEDWTFQLNY